MSRLPPALAAAFVLAWVTAASAQTHTGLSLRAQAGLGGITRPGAWTPVIVTITNTAGAIDGTLIADWGHEQLHRTLHLASPSERQIALTLRTSNVADRIRLRFVSDAGELASTDVPIRVARPDDPFVLCVQAAGLARCTTTLGPEQLPSSWRAYDAVDELVWPSADRSGLTAAQRNALDDWQVIHPLATAGNLASPPVDPEPSGAPLRQNAWLFALYLVSIAAAALAWRTRAGLARERALALGVVVLAGSTVALAAGRVGPGASVVLTQNTVVDAFAGLPDALVSVRAVAEFPAFATFGLIPSLVDVSLDRAQATGAIEFQADDGTPVLTGTFGLGSRQAFSLSGLVRLTLLEATSRDHAMRVTNASDTALTDCALEDASGTTLPLRTLNPGAHADLPPALDATTATVSCTAQGSVITFADPRHAVLNGGAVKVVLHLGSPVMSPSREGSSR